MSEGFINQFLDSGTIVSLDPERLMIGWGTRKWLTKPDNFDTPLFYFPDFFLSTVMPWFQSEFWLEITKDALIEALSVFQQPLPFLDWNYSSKEEFRRSFIHLKGLIAENQLEKAVPYVFSSTPECMSKTRLANSLHSLLKATKDYPLLVYGFWEGEEGILGASPEMLFEYKKEKEITFLETVACAGTCSRKDRVDTFFSDLKENHEHQLVIDGILESLSSYGSAKLGERRLLELPSLVHLVTPIHAQFDREVSFETITDALHPTPALGVFPKREGKKWLSEYQNRIPRGRYGAPAGFILPGNKEAQCYVAIRNVQWNEQGLFIGAGCGVVKESVFEKEWQEICLKTNTIKELLSI